MLKRLIRLQQRFTRAVIIAFYVLAAARFASAAEPSDLDNQTRAIATELRCVVCQNLSVADSPSEMAKQMRGVIREQLQAGKKPDEIKKYFVSKYGEWVLLDPSKSGISLAVWVLPFVALIIGLSLGLWFLRRWTKRRKHAPVASVDSVLVERVRAEAVNPKNLLLAQQDEVTPTSELEQDRARLYTDLNEREFDYHAGKLSESDYRELRQETEIRAAAVLQKLDATPQPAKSKPAASARKETTAAKAAGFRPWQLVAGGVFLLLFGLTLGVVLTQSLRPRQSEQDSLTGGFLTGIANASNSTATVSALDEGKAAFEKQDWPKAIDAFNRVLASDPNQPEAHTYMGFILVQAGHADGALMAFDKALAGAPNFPMALWGKGMTLYKEKQDYAGAREVLGRLAAMMPPGEERGQVEKVLAEIPATGGKPVQQTAAAAPASVGAQISGKITLDPKLKANVDNHEALFIIARAAGTAGGPPLAVKKVDHPTFPVSYTLGQENVMMQGIPFAASVAVIARLDKDGNPTTRQPGDLTGDYKKNPVAVSSQNIDIVLDQVVQ
jgi:cytochrome c-type biogenesis protein CcmH